MDLLLNPDVGYFLLAAGTFLVLLAIVTPGSGFAELGAIFCLLMAGYSIYHLAFNWWALVLLLLSIVPFILAIQRTGREIWLILSILGMIVGSVFFFPNAHGGPSVNPLLAIFTSVAYALTVWIFVRKVILVKRTGANSDLSNLLGQSGETKTAVERDGSVQVAGELWSARSKTLIPVGKMVRVVGREGFILIVENQNS
jgi:membrane-bound ClpP family serine protease